MKLHKLIVENDDTFISESSLFLIKEGKVMHPIIRDDVDSNLNGKSFFLSPLYNWTLGLDSLGATVLVPLRKKRNFN